MKIKRVYMIDGVPDEDFSGNAAQRPAVCDRPGLFFQARHFQAKRDWLGSTKPAICYGAPAAVYSFVMVRLSYHFVFNPLIVRSIFCLFTLARRTAHNLCALHTTLILAVLL